MDGLVGQGDGEAGCSISSVDGRDRKMGATQRWYVILNILVSPICIVLYCICRSH